MLLFVDSAIHFLVGLLEFIDFSGLLHRAIFSSIRSLESTRGSVGFLPTDFLLQGTVGLILLQIWSVMACMCTPMFAKGAMFLVGDVS